jgi:hypothetical protein
VISDHPRDLGEMGSRVAMLAIVDGTMLKNEIKTEREFDAAATRHFTSWVRSYARLSRLRTDLIYVLESC